MPVLHEYKDHSGCYVLTSIQRNIVTFQLTPAGEQRLHVAGVVVGQRFARGILLDLYRKGDAFTRHGGPGLIEDLGQMEMDLQNDPDTEQAFPRCSGCGSVDDLHLAITRQDSDQVAILLCSACRPKRASQVETLVPLPLVSLPWLEKLLLHKAAKPDGAVRRYQDLLRAEFEARWEALSAASRVRQGNLLDLDGGNELKLR